MTFKGRKRSWRNRPVFTSFSRSRLVARITRVEPAVCSAPGLTERSSSRNRISSAWAALESMPTFVKEEGAVRYRVRQRSSS